MDYATQLAFRAIVSGLHYAGTIDQRHVSAIVQALGDAATKATRENQHPAAHHLAKLRADIARDGQVE